ncbi:MAG: protein translocase subunit SecF, partial [Desulfobacteraceae bacterium]
MQFIKPDINLDFIGKRKTGFFFSLALILISFASLIIHQGPNYGIDFAGGTLVQIKFTQETSTGDIRTGLARMGLTDASVQSFGKQEAHEYLIRTSIPASTGEGLADSVAGAVEKTTGEKPEIRRVEMVGPQVGKDLRKQALLAMFYSLLFITVYISGRFEMKWMISGITAGSLMTAVYFLSIFNMSMPMLITAAVIVTLILFWFLELKYAMGA